MESKHLTEADLLALLRSLEDSESPEALCAAHGIGPDLARALWQRRRNSVSEASPGFSEHLQSLLEVVNELAKAPGFDDLCRRAAELSVSRLGFERIGIWFRDEDPAYLRGSFGVGEDGALRDERERRVLIREDDEDAWRVLNREVRFVSRSDVDLRDADGHTVGQGTRVMAPLWDGEEVIGFIYIDNHLSHKEIPEDQCRIVALFAASVGHLCAIHRTAEALRQSESRLRLIMDQAPAAMWTTDRNLVFTSSMGSVLSRLGLKTNETVGQHVETYFRTNDPEFFPVKAHYEALSGKPMRFEQVWQRMVFQTSVEPLHDGDGQIIGTIGTAVDITEVRKSEEERRKLEAQVQHAQKLESLGVLAGGIAHDFNNLLVSVLGNAELAQLEVIAGSPAHLYLGEIGRAACRAADLCKQMLAYSGKGKFLLEMVDLNAIAKEMGGLMGASVSKNTTIDYCLAKDLPAVEGDATQLRQVVMNLVTNASEALDGKQGVVSIATGVAHVTEHDIDQFDTGEKLAPGDYVFLDVTDTGCGMDRATCERVFDPFFSTKFTGRGLGLAAVLGIVRGHEGGIRVDSILGEGTTFRLLLPPQEAQAAITPKKGSPALGSCSGTILIIDDEDQVRDMAATMLEVAGYTVLSAGEARKGIQMLEEHAGEVEAVLLDMSMPCMDGAEAFEKLRAIDPHVPIVLCSGYGREASMARFQEGQLAGFLAKPFLMHDLLDAVNVAVTA